MDNYYHTSPAHQSPEDYKRAIFGTARILEAWQPMVSQGVTQDDFLLYLKMWELLALNRSDVLREVNVMRPSEITVIDDMPDVFGDFINSLEFQAVLKELIARRAQTNGFYNCHVIARLQPSMPPMRLMYREILRPSEVEIVPDIPDAFDEFINSLEF